LAEEEEKKRAGYRLIDWSLESQDEEGKGFSGFICILLWGLCCSPGYIFMNLKGQLLPIGASFAAI